MDEICNARGRAITQHTIISESTAEKAPLSPAQPRARGTIEMRVKANGARTTLRDLYQAGSSKCLFPRNARKHMDAVLLNTAGGVTGGDRFSFSAHAEEQTELTLTTQACERAYKAQGGEIGEVSNKLSIAENARINWLPQETILFNHSALSRSLRVDLAPDASFLMLEPLVFGRTAMGEALNHAQFRDRIEIYRENTPLYIDALHLTGDIAAQLAQPFVANGAGAMASLVFVDANAETYLEPLRELLPTTGGASMLRPDTLVMRVLAQDSFELRKTLFPILSQINNGQVPRCWTL